MYRIGFACQYRHPDERLSVKELESIERAFNPRTTTLRWLNSVAREQASAKLHEIVDHNLEAQRQLIDYVAMLPEPLRMLRLSSQPRMAAITSYSMPVFVAILGWLLLGEALQPYHWVGGGLIFGGLLLATLQRPA